MVLVKPSLEWETAFMEMASDWESSRGNRYYKENGWNHDSYEQYLRSLWEESQGLNLKPERVRSDTFWLVDENVPRICGISRLRHTLNAFLKHEGGHIGYEVPPSQRRKGYGTFLLALTLNEAWKLGLKQVLVTCHANNTGSSKIIQKNGGILENQVISTRDGEWISRYWISRSGPL